MKRSIFGLLAVTVLAGSTGCCCLDRLFCWGCNGCGGCGYGNEGPCYGGCGGCGGGCSSCGGGCGGGCSDCGYAGGSVNGGGYASRSANGGGYANGPPGGAYAGGPQGGQGGQGGPRVMVNNRPANGHPFVKQRRDSGDDYEFAAGPPTGATTYPYYTNRGPRDFLARNPRDIGP